MVQFKIISGKMAGTHREARRFPFRIGRAASADLQVDDHGIWDQHLELEFDPSTGFILSACPNALASINGLPFDQAVLRNGDAIEIGALKMRFWLGETRQTSLGLRETLMWIGYVLVSAVQLYLIYRLTP